MVVKGFRAGTVVWGEEVIEAATEQYRYCVCFQSFEFKLFEANWGVYHFVVPSGGVIDECRNDSTRWATAVRLRSGTNLCAHHHASRHPRTNRYCVTSGPSPHHYGTCTTRGTACITANISASANNSANVANALLSKPLSSISLSDSHQEWHVEAFGQTRSACALCSTSSGKSHIVWVYYQRWIMWP